MIDKIEGMDCLVSGINNQYIFRGKKRESLNYYYGSFIQFPDGTGAIVSGEGISKLKCNIVDVETVGQCVGKYDKNKRLMFVGDIVQFYNGSTGKKNERSPIEFIAHIGFCFKEPNSRGDFGYNVFKGIWSGEGNNGYGNYPVNELVEVVSAIY